MKTAMKSAKKLYPRVTMRKIIKGHARRKIGRNVDACVYYSYIKFIEELMAAATTKARAEGEKNIRAKDIRKVTMSALREFKT